MAGNIAALNSSKQHVFDKIPSFLEEARITKLKISKEFSGRKGAKPYLDKIALSSHIGDDGIDFWKKLLIQPVAIPSLEHTGISTALAPSGEQLLRPDGGSTSGLKKLIKSSISVVEVVSSKDPMRSQATPEGLKRSKSVQFKPSPESPNTQRASSKRTKPKKRSSSKTKKRNSNQRKAKSFQRLKNESSSSDTLNPWKQFDNMLNGIYDARKLDSIL